MTLCFQISGLLATPDIVSLKGMRLVYANETEEGRRLAEARVKDMTGGDTLTGRVPYGKADIIFRPTHKLIMVGNHKPKIASVRVIGAQDIEDQNTRRAVDRFSRRPGDTRSRACGSPKQCRDDVLNSNRHWPAPYATCSARGFAI
jgi:hypothetical protein